MRKFITTLLLILLSIGSICTIAFGYNNWGFIWGQSNPVRAIQNYYSQGGFGSGGSLWPQAISIFSLSQKGGSGGKNNVTANGITRNSEERELVAKGGTGSKGNLTAIGEAAHILRSLIGKGSAGRLGVLALNGKTLAISSISGQGSTGGANNALTSGSHTAPLSVGAAGSISSFVYTAHAHYSVLSQGATGSMSAFGTIGGNGITNRNITIGGIGAGAGKGSLTRTAQGVNTATLSGQGGTGSANTISIVRTGNVYKTLLAAGASGGVPSSTGTTQNALLIGLVKGSTGSKSNLSIDTGSSSASSSEILLSGIGSIGRRGTISVNGSSSGYIVQDTFTNTTGTDLASHTGENGAIWTRVATAGTGTAQIGSNRLCVSTDTGSSLYYASGISNADVRVSADIYVASQLAGGLVAITARNPSSDYRDGYVFRYTVASGQWSIGKYVSGAITQLGTAYSQTLNNSSTYHIELKVVGSTIEGYVDGVLRTSATDTTYTAAGKSGIRLYHGSTTSGFQVDNFIVQNN